MERHVNLDLHLSYVLHSFVTSHRKGCENTGLFCSVVLRLWTVSDVFGAYLVRKVLHRSPLGSSCSMMMVLRFGRREHHRCTVGPSR